MQLHGRKVVDVQIEDVDPRDYLISVMHSLHMQCLRIQVNLSMKMTWIY